jgi:hypothetical protein
MGNLIMPITMTTATIRKKKPRDNQPTFPCLSDEQPEIAEDRTGFNDPAFASNKTLPVHRWVPWIAGFSSDFVSNALTTYLPKSGTVLDPFSGVGTTLVEAVEHGHDAIGFEINPYAALATRIKATAHRIELDSLIATAVAFKAFYSRKSDNGYMPKSKAPEGFKTRAEFYSCRVLHKVLVAQDFINSIPDEKLRELFSLAFASTMVRYSNYSYEPSLGRRVSAGKGVIEDYPVMEEISKKISDMIEDIAWLHKRDIVASATVINDSFFNCTQYVEKGTVDLVVTSPPYLNNYHYNRNTRPHLYWLGFAHSVRDFDHLENSNFGKFWQTVREQECLELDFNLPDSDIKERLDELRRLNPDKGVYGGNGWANYAAAYFNDCRRLMTGLKHVLRRKGTALVVIGNSILQGLPIPTDVYLGKIGEAAGLELVRIDVPRATRVGNSIIQSNVRVAKAHTKHQLYEAVVEFRKP